MQLTGNIPINVKEEAFSDIAPKLKKIERVVVGIGDGYISEDKQKRYIKVYFGNNPKQTTKNLSYTKPINSTNVNEILSGLKKILDKEQCNFASNCIFESEGISLKDKKELKTFFQKNKAA